MSQPKVVVVVIIIIVTNFKGSLTISISKCFGRLWFLTDQDIYIFCYTHSSKYRWKGSKYLQDITLLYNVLYKNLSFKLQET